MAEKVFLQVIPEKGYSIEDQNGQEYTLAKAKELHKKGLVIPGPTFEKLCAMNFDMQKLKEYYS